MTQKTKRYTSIDILKILSMLLIIQSHEDRLFPDRLQALASGGAIGNALFFVISGFLMKTDGGGRDAAKRLFRLYLPVYLMSVINLATGNLVLHHPVDVIYYFIYPTDFTFISTNLLCYLMVLGAVHLESRRRGQNRKQRESIPEKGREDLKKHNERRMTEKSAVQIVLGVSVILDAVIYLFLMDHTVWTIEDDKIPGTWIDFKAIYSLSIFCIGILIRERLEDNETRRDAKRNDKEKSIGNKKIGNIEEKLQQKSTGKHAETDRKKGRRECLLFLFLSFAALFLFLVMKIAFNRRILTMRFQILLQVPVVLSAVFILLFFVQAESLFCHLSSRPVRYLSDITLESYLVQFDLIGIAASSRTLAFPSNVLVTDLLILGAAALFRTVDNKLIRMATEKL